MQVPDRNLRKPARPIPRDGYPENRRRRAVEGGWINVKTVIPVGGPGDRETWWSLADRFGLRPWEIIWANFETDVPEEVNWYLREYVGCHKLGPRGRNQSFDGADPGLILLPFDDATVALLAERKRGSKPRQPDIIDARWPDRQPDLRAGELLADLMVKHAFREAASWARNDLAFDPVQAAKDMEGNLGRELAKSITYPFREMSKDQQRVMEIRRDIYSGFAAGVASVLGAEKHTIGIGSGRFRVFREKGRDHASRLTRLQRYQLALALCEGRQRRRMGSDNPLTERQARGCMSPSSLQLAVEERLSSMRHLYRNE